MKHFPGRKKRQRGAALLVLAAILVLGISWMMISALGNASQRTYANREHNARVLAEAKAALTAWVAMNALDGSENNPGRLPCPQAWGDMGSANEGRAAAVCSATAAGWLPWRTLGLQKPLDASGHQIWYVVSPGWHLPNATASLTINSNTAGQLALDGQAAVALLIAPGAALNIAPNANQTAAGCTARSQVQALNLPASAPNPLDFLDCQNGTKDDNVFTTSVVDNTINLVFNDQVLAMTTADLLPALEAAIAKRIERDISPALRAAYVGTKWNTSAGDTVFPFAASFLPAGPGTSSYLGAALTQGLLPFSYSPPCSPLGDPRCMSSTFHAWGTPALSRVAGSGSLWGSPACAVSGSWITCQGYYISGSLQASFDDPVSNVANALRDFNLADHMATVQTNLCRIVGGACTWDGYQIETSTLTRRFNSSGSLSFVVSTPFRWASGKDWGYYYIQAQRPAITDHPLLSASTGSSTGWFVRNEWYRLAYYAIAPNHAAGGTLSCEDSTPTCLQVANVLPSNKQRSILILAGRSLNGMARPNANLADFLEGGNADLNTTFEQRAVNAAFNDRVVVIDANP